MVSSNTMDFVEHDGFRGMGNTVMVSLSPFKALALAMLLGSSQAQAADPAVRWLWSDTSPSVNRSTEALATGHLGRARTLALESARMATPADMRIAAHNLCLVHLRSGVALETDDACRNALTGPDSAVVMRRGALVANAEDSVPGLAQHSLSAIVTANIAAAAGHAVVAPIITAAQR